MIKKLSLSFSLFGIIILLILSNILNPISKEVGELTDKDINKKIKIKGVVTEIKKYENYQTLKIKDGAFYINGIIYSKVNISEGEDIYLTGIISKYKNNLQIKIYSIEKFEK
jgi:DNA/RNA endonuclease YhcR with UshA esterase domain